LTNVETNGAPYYDKLYQLEHRSPQSSQYEFQRIFEIIANYDNATGHTGETG